MVITNLSEAQEYARETNAVLVRGSFLERENSSKEGVAVFWASKKLVINGVTDINYHDHHIRSSMQSRNLTLWNKIDDVESPIGNAILKVLYVFSSVLLLPLFDWVIGHLRFDQEVISYYESDTDPNNSEKSQVRSFESYTWA